MYRVNPEPWKRSVYRRDASPPYHRNTNGR